jgi:tRNA pseudouridine13 synthase
VTEPSRADSPAPDGRGPVAAGLGGLLRSRPEDFVVEEIPLERPLGRGDHTIVQVEKRDASTFEILLWLSKAAKVSENVIGYAGLKDAQAVARQAFSLPRVPPSRLLGLRRPRFRVLAAARHPSPLKIGHLRGNRFTVRLRDADVAAVPAAREALERIVRDGLPNAYGEQRFGTRRDGHLVGRAVVAQDWSTFLGLVLGRPSPHEKDPRVRAAREAYDAGDLDRAFDLFPMRHRTEKKALAALRRTGSPREAFRALDRRPRRIWVAAWQSWLFNRILERRVADGSYARLLPGDLAWRRGSGALYPVRDEAAEAERVARGEASATGPLVGYDLRFAEGEPGGLEREVLREEGADPEAFRSEPARARGGRRPLRVPVREASIEVEEGRHAVVRFVLPPGSFATVLLRALRGASDDPPAADVPEDD